MKQAQPIRLIVNADDYAYFACTSRGILDGVRAGSITATGILANAENLSEQLDWLAAIDGIDVGIHLNLTHGSPLTTTMQHKLSAYQGRFPGLYRMSYLVLSGKIGREDVADEWRAQIERCRQFKLKFLNSHQHIHMLPDLLPIAVALAEDYQIAYVRQTLPDWHLHRHCQPGVVLRNLLLQTVNIINRSARQTASPRLIGLNGSGQLNLPYLENLFARLSGGQCYELMCHPCYFDDTEISDQSLLAYHHWEAELALLNSPELQSLYQKYNIRLSGYA